MATFLKKIGYFFSNIWSPFVNAAKNYLKRLLTFGTQLIGNSGA